MCHACSRVLGVPEPLDPKTLFRVLDHHGVDYLLIGALAASLHGSPLGGVEAEICPADSEANRAALALALDDLIASNDPVLDKRTPARLTTRAGALRISFAHAPQMEFAVLASRAGEVELFGVRVRALSLADMILNAELGNRLEERAMLPHLYALEDEIAAIERERTEGAK
jgi:hypothetical protein